MDNLRDNRWEVLHWSLTAWRGCGANKVSDLPAMAQRPGKTDA